MKSITRPLAILAITVLAAANPVELVGRQTAQSTVAATSAAGSAPTGTSAAVSAPSGTVAATSSAASATGLAGVTGVDSNVTGWAYLWGWEGCSTTQKAAVLNGLSEAHTILGSPGVYSIDSHWNDFATVEFLGSPWYAMQNNGRSTIKDRFNKAYNYQQSWFSWYDTQVFCLADNQGYCADEASFIAVENNFDKNGLALGFCQRYFRLGTLDAIYNKVSRSYYPYDLSEYENRARPWITAMMRISWIANLVPQSVPFPGNGIAKPVESCSQTKFLAKNSRNRDAQVKTLANPSNYAWYALAQYVQNKFTKYPSHPQTPDELAPAF